MAIFTEDTTIGTTSGFPFDTIGGVGTRTRRELTDADALDIISASVDGLTLTIPENCSYTAGDLFSMSTTANGVTPPTANGRLNLVVMPGAFFQFKVRQSRSFSAGTIDFRPGSVVVVINDGNGVWPSNTGNNPGITSMRLNGILVAVGNCTLHGRALSTTAFVNLDGLDLRGNWGIQFPTSADWRAVNAPNPGSSGNEDSNDRFFRLVRPSLGTIAQRWSEIDDGTWDTNTETMQIQRATNQYPTETDVIFIGPRSQFPNISIIKLGSQDGGSTAVHNIRRAFRWNPEFIDVDTGAVINDVRLIFAHSSPVRKVTSDKTTRYEDVPVFVDGVTLDTATGYLIQTDINTKSDNSTTPTAGISVDHDTTIPVFAKSFTHLIDESLTTEHNIGTTSTPVARTANPSLNGRTETSAEIQLDTPITSTDDLYPQLLLAYVSDETDNFALPIVITGANMTINATMNSNTNDAQVSANSVTFHRGNLMAMGIVNNFILNHAADGGDTIIVNNAITGNVTFTRGADANLDHGLNIIGTTVDGILTLANDTTDIFQVLNLGTATGTFTELVVNNNVSLVLDIADNVTIDLDSTWGPQTYGTGVTISNQGIGQVSLLSTSAAASGVTAGNNITFTESVVFNNATATGAVLRLYDATTFSGSATPLQTITGAGMVTLSLPAVGQNFIARISAVGFASLVIETGLITAGNNFAAPTLTPTPLAVTTGVPAGLTITTSGTQTVGNAGTTIAITGANTQIVNGTSTNPLFASATVLQGFGRGVLLNWNAITDRIIGEWTDPIDQLVTFDIGVDSVTLANTARLIPGDTSIQRLQGINDSDNNVFNTTTTTSTDGFTSDTVTSVPNTNPNAILIADIVNDELAPVITQGSNEAIAAANAALAAAELAQTASEAAETAAKSTEAEIKLSNP